MNETAFIYVIITKKSIHEFEREQDWGDMGGLEGGKGRREAM